MSGRFAGRTVAVTGAASGIGGAVARRASDEGAQVVCIDLNLEGARNTAASLNEAVAVACDVTSYEQVQASLETATDALGRIDVLVTSAGGSRGEAVPFLDLDPATWHQMIDRNLTGTFHCGLVYARHMAERGGGAMVFISSQLSAVVRPGLAHYSASKGAINQLVKGMAVDLASAGVRVNAVAPGPTQTPGNQAWFDRPEVVAEHQRIIPLGRVGEPAEIAGAVLYLASDDATFTTGTTVFVDGGYTII